MGLVAFHIEMYINDSCKLLDWRCGEVVAANCDDFFFARPRGSAYIRLCLSVGLSVPLFLPTTSLSVPLFLPTTSVAVFASEC